jgi:uncharacterized protein (UPF0264 family)
LLIDTFGKAAGGLFEWLGLDELMQLSVAARQAGLWFALAGRLSPNDIDSLLSIGPDVVGIRSAACRFGRREGQIDSGSVREFHRRLTTRPVQRHAATTPD